MKPGRWVWRTGAWLSFLALFIGISAWNHRPWWDMAFRSDDSPISWLSGALLFASAAVAWRLGAARALPARLSIWLTLSLVALSLDERFMLHEYWKYHCFQWTWCKPPQAGSIDILGDSPMLLVGALGLATLIWMRRAITSAVARRLALAGVAVGVCLALGTHYGVAGEWLPPSLAYLEEAFEVLAETLFLCALIETGMDRESLAEEQPIDQR